jgi:hypothetical protein
MSSEKIKKLFYLRPALRSVKCAGEPKNLTLYVYINQFN